MKKKYYKKGLLSFQLYLIVSYFMGTIAFADTKNNALSIQHAVNVALQQNPGLAQIQKRYEALKEVPSQVETLPDPVISIGAMNFPTDTFDRAQEPMTSVQVGFSQAFPYPGKLDLRAHIAELTATAAFHSIDEAKLSLTNFITSTWWELYYLDRSLDTIASNKVLLRQFIDIAQEKYKTGKGLQQDVLLAQLELSKLTDQEIQVAALRRNQNINLNLLMGRDPSLDIVLGKKMKKELSAKINEKYLYQLAREYRPSIKKEESNLLAANSRLDLAKKDYYPDFKVSASYGDRSGYNPGTINDPRADLFSLKLSMQVPLYYKTKQSKAEQQKFIEKENSFFALENEKLNVMAQISKYFTDYKQAKKQLSLYKTGILPQARQTVESMRSGYQVSKVDFLNLVRSQVTLFNYELLYWKSFKASMQSLSNIQAKVGKVNIYE